MATKRKRSQQGSNKKEQQADSQTAQEHIPQQQQVQKQKGRPDTAFEQRLFKLCKLIPAGKVSTYGAMAKALGSSARAVGQGMRRNPHAPAVPCHRVVASDFDLGGFSGSWGAHTCSVQRKKAMLEAEGIAFQGSKVASPDCVLSVEQLVALLQKDSKIA